MCCHWRGWLERALCFKQPEVQFLMTEITREITDDLSRSCHQRTQVRVFFGWGSLAMTERGVRAQDSLPRNTFWTGHKAEQGLWGLRKPLDFPLSVWTLTTQPSDNEKGRDACRWRGSVRPREGNEMDFKIERGHQGPLKADVFWQPKKFRGVCWVSY